MVLVSRKTWCKRKAKYRLILQCKYRTDYVLLLGRNQQGQGAEELTFEWKARGSIQKED